MNQSLRDLIYFDVSKATSLLSQLEGGVLKEIRESEETTGKKMGSATLGIKLLEGGIEKESSDRAAVERTKVLHHAILADLEEWLFANGYALDLNRATGHETIDEDCFRQLMTDVSYVRAEGVVTIEDFSRLQKMAREFESIVAFLNRCTRSTLEQSEQYKEVIEQLAEGKKRVKGVKDRNEKARQQAMIKSFETSLNSMVEEIAVEAPEDWLMEGIADWIDIFNRDQIHLRVRPFRNSLIEVITNLKREYLVDTDIDHLLFSYGSRPDIALTLFGLVTSVPPKVHTDLELKSKNYESKPDNSNQRDFEFAFRNVFNSMNGLEEFAGLAHYPNIKVYPIAVYRKIISTWEENSTE